MNFQLKKTAALILALGLLAFAVSPLTAQKQRQSIPTSPDKVSDDDQSQLWQGRVVRTKGDTLTVKVEGESETFHIDHNAKILKDRRPAKMDALLRGDFVNIRTIGQGKKEVAISVRAFSLR